MFTVWALNALLHTVLEVLHLGLLMLQGVQYHGSLICHDHHLLRGHNSLWINLLAILKALLQLQLLVNLAAHAILDHLLDVLDFAQNFARNLILALVALLILVHTIVGSSVGLDDLVVCHVGRSYLYHGSVVLFGYR